MTDKTIDKYEPTLIEYPWQDIIKIIINLWKKPQNK